MWVSVIGDDKERRATLQALGRAMPFVRHQLGDLRLRRIPELHLREDDTAERGTRVLQLLEELEAAGPEGPSASSSRRRAARRCPRRTRSNDPGRALPMTPRSRSRRATVAAWTASPCARPGSRRGR